MKTKTFVVEVEIELRKGEWPELPEGLELEHHARENMRDRIQDIRSLIIDEWDENNVPVYVNVKSCKVLR